MITAAQIRPLYQEAVGDEKTAQLKAKLARIRQERKPLYLTAAEFEDILEWKLAQQIGRQRHLRAGNTDELMRDVTALALSVTHADKEYELELRVNTLCVLRGVSVPVASAVLALMFPNEYAVIDFRVWRQLFGEEKSAFYTTDYKKYMDKIHQLADELDWPVQVVDHVIWLYDKQNSKPFPPSVA